MSKKQNKVSFMVYNKGEQYTYGYFNSYERALKYLTDTEAERLDEFEIHQVVATFERT